FASYGAASAQDGQDYELLAIVAAVIGGTSLFGVTGTIIGTFIGALILGMLQAGLILVGVPGDWYEPLIGVILVVAVIVNGGLSKLGLSAAFARFAFAPCGEPPGPGAGGEGPGTRSPRRSSSSRACRSSTARRARSAT